MDAFLGVDFPGLPEDVELREIGTWNTEMPLTIAPCDHAGAIPAIGIPWRIRSALIERWIEFTSGHITPRPPPLR